MTAPAHTAETQPAPGRDARLANAVARLRTRASGADVDRWLMVAGPGIAVFGVLVIYLAWYGASQTTRVFLQIPYLISGGLFGLGLMFFGGFLYFARWLNDLVGETRRQAQEAQQVAERSVEALERIEGLMRAQGVAVAASGTGGSGAGTFVATPRGSMFHLPDCPMVAGRDVRSVDAGGVLEPCQICEPTGD